jgi:3,4-dihydroxy-9,10-secoandrosta-1,3,5(10)-triene-9,17-dione 4,5-dioxygenase
MDVRGLAYVVVDAVDPHQWISFGENVLGMQAFKSPDGGVRLKMDERAARYYVRPARSDRYAISGWEVADEAAFDAAKSDLQRAGINFTQGDRDLAIARNVIDLIAFKDPSGNNHELSWGHRSDYQRMISPAGVAGFVTGDQGMGHTVLPAPNFDETWRFFRDVMGFGMADLMVHRPGGETGPAMRINFTHCNNPRHHSLALFEGEVASGCVHVMIEYQDMDEVGRAMDRAAKHKAKLMASLGRHINDGVVSFYVQSPAGFAFEIGYGGRRIDWADHIAFESTAASLWGHDFSIGFSNA